MTKKEKPHELGQVGKKEKDNERNQAFQLIMYGTQGTKDVAKEKSK